MDVRRGKQPLHGPDEVYLSSLYRALNNLAHNIGKTSDELIDEYWAVGELEAHHVEAHKLWSEISVVSRRVKTRAGLRLIENPRPMPAKATADEDSDLIAA